VIAPYYEDAGIRLYLGDCRELMPELGANAAAIVTDPPYGETSLTWDRWPTGWIDALPSAPPQMWCFGSMRMFLERSAEFRFWSYGQEVVWEKHNGSGFQADRFKRVHELATHWFRGPWSSLTINPVMVPGATKRTVHRKGRPVHMGNIDDHRYETERGGPKMERSVIYVRSCHGHAIHPTEKPLGIIEPLIRYSTNPGDEVLDPFAGSGAVLDAARQNGRRAVGIEADEAHCERAAHRLAQGSLFAASEGTA
jgi:site-specific DNA-methyltransferase (adenine-specific)